jgi:hypothetical protein
VWLGKEDSSEHIMTSVFNRHRNSKKCKTRQVMLGEDAQGEEVVFESPMTLLVVNLHVPVVKELHGQVVHTTQVYYAEFSRGEFRSRDPKIIKAMRKSPSNVNNIEASGGYVPVHKDRFYEVSGPIVTPDDVLMDNVPDTEEEALDAIA